METVGRNIAAVIIVIAASASTIYTVLVFRQQIEIRRFNNEWKQEFLKMTKPGVYHWWDVSVYTNDQLIKLGYTYYDDHYYKDGKKVPYSELPRPTNSTACGYTKIEYGKGVNCKGDTIVIFEYSRK